MARFRKRWALYIAAAVLLYYTYAGLSSLLGSTTGSSKAKRFKWRDLPTDYPPFPLRHLPTGRPASIPRIQFDFSQRHESFAERKEREKRLAAVKEAFQHSWDGYRKYAWLQDELKPLSAGHANPFGGWGATLIDSLDTLYIMGLEPEFAVAVAALKQIDFSKCDLEEINVFETTIRHLGGLLSAHDLAGHKYRGLLDKAVEVGDMLYKAFDTPNRMPVARWSWRAAQNGIKHTASSNMLIAELGSLTLEFTRLSQLTGDPKYYDAVQRIAERLAFEQDKTKVPGLWPIGINAQSEEWGKWEQKSFTLGGMADSVYEYLPKSHLLLLGRIDAFRMMYLKALDPIKNFLLFEPLLPPDSLLQHANDTPLSLGTLNLRVSDAGTTGRLDPKSQHLTCFAGGMFALAARVFSSSRPAADTALDINIATRLTDGCIWAYRNTPVGVAPEVYYQLACRAGRAAITSGLEPDLTGSKGDCTWNRTRWISEIRRALPHIDALKDEAGPNSWENYIRDANLREGFTVATDARYLLRPEAIESIFILWRITGDTRWQESAWEIFVAVTRATRTDFGFAGLQDVMNSSFTSKIDQMESFWTAESLKYFWLVFEDPNRVSLDEFVFNTEAHPFRWR